MPRSPLNIDRTAWFLIRRYGDDSAIVAFHRVLRCVNLNNKAAEREWRLVLNKVIELHFVKPTGAKH